MRPLLRRHGAALGAMAVATLTFLGPVLLRLPWVVGAQERSEVWNHIWAHWLVGRELSHLSSPLHTSMLNPPEGLGFYVADPVLAAAVTLVRPFTGLVAGFNLVLAATLLGTMVAVYALALELSRSRVVSAGAGILVGLSPYVRSVFMDGYTEALGLFWAALILRNLLLLGRDPTWARAVLGGLLFAGTFYTDLYTTVAVALVYVIAAVWIVAARWQGIARRAGMVAVGPALGLLLAVPGALALSGASPPLEGEPAMPPLPIKTHCWHLAGFSGAADVASYLPPTDDLTADCTHLLVRGVYPGILAELCLLGLLIWHRRLTPGLVPAALACAALSLGDYVSFRGHPLGEDWRPLDGSNVPLMGPQFVLAGWLPAVGGLHSPYRLASMVTLICGAGAAVVAGKLWVVRWLRPAAVLLLALCLADTLLLSKIPFPCPTTAMTTSPALEWLDDQPGDGAVLEWPVEAPWDPFECDGMRFLSPERVLFHQTVHRKPYAALGPSQWFARKQLRLRGKPQGAYSERTRWEPMPSAGLLTDLARLGCGTGEPSTGADGAAPLAAGGLGPGVVHPPDQAAAPRRATAAFLEGLFGPPVTFDDGAAIYLVGGD